MNKDFQFSIFNFLIIPSVIVLSFFGCPVNAQDVSPGLSVSPHTFEFGVLPGDIITDKIKLQNKSEVALPILTRAVDFTAADEEGAMAFDEFSQDISFASRKWIEINKPNFILGPNETEEVHFEIKIPENAEPCGHYATMLFEPQMPSFYFKEDQTRVVPIIGVLFLFSVQNLVLDLDESATKQKLEVVEFSVPKEERIVALENFASRMLGSVVQAAGEIAITKKSPQNFILRIQNNDIYHAKPFGKVVIYNVFNKKVGETEIPKKTILPGKVRRFPVEFSPEVPEKIKWLPASVSDFLIQNFFVGKYRAEIKLQTKTPFTGEILQPDIPITLTFFSLPWKFWLGFILIFGFLIFLTAKYRKRIVKCRERIKLATKTLLNPKLKT